MAPPPISNRAQQNIDTVNWLAIGAIAWSKNKHHVTDNPTGIINLGTAENKLMAAQLTDYFNNSSSLTAKDDLPSFHTTSADLLYGSFNGTLALREQVANLMNKHWKPQRVVKVDDLAMGNGAGSLVSALGNILGDSGDVVLIPSPVYGVFYNDLNVYNNVKPVFVDGPYSIPSVQDLEKAYNESTSRLSPTNKVAALLITNPGNPLGQVIPRSTLRAWIQWAHTKNIHVIADEVYALSVWGTQDPEEEEIGTGRAKFVSVLEMEEGTEIPDREAIHLIWSFSKDFGMSGMRSAVLQTYNKAVMKAYMELCYFHMVPRVVESSLARLLANQEFVTSYFSQNRAILLQTFTKLAQFLESNNIPYINPNAGIFAWLDLRKWAYSPKLLSTPSKASTGQELKSKSLLMYARFLEAGVYVAPGDAFFVKEDGYVRVIFSMPWDGILEVAMSRIVGVLRELE
ncbi:hypothetical protein HDV05_007385 [Chytridiales sp. JEL 0842]|nr:hypothetical protein HDV05_007385 [Chytridiales sp. JEL 0842]